MLLTGRDYIESIRDGREVWIDGERVTDVPSHPAFKPMVDVRARVYDMAHEDVHRDAMTVAADDGEAAPSRASRRGPKATCAPSGAGSTR